MSAKGIIYASAQHLCQDQMESDDHFHRQRALSKHVPVRPVGPDVLNAFSFVSLRFNSGARITHPSWTASC